MPKLRLYFVLILLLYHRADGQDYEIQKNLLHLAERSSGWQEGFSKNLGGNEFIYHSLRNDVTACLLTRCTDGQMEISWETAPAKDLPEGGTGFVWIAAINHEPDDKYFDFYVNDRKQFEIRSGNTAHWVLSNSEGYELEFVPVTNDQHGDVHGYMTLFAPSKYLIPGKPLVLKLVGRAGGSQTWMIIYQAKDALSYLHNSMTFNSWCELEAKRVSGEYLLNLTFPSRYAGKTITLKSGKTVMRLEPEISGNLAQSSSRFPVKGSGNVPLLVEDEYNTLLFRNNIAETGPDTQILSGAIVSSEVSVLNDGTIKIRSIRSYRPKTSELLMQVNRSGVNDGIIYLMNSSHQDIAWMDDPERCVILRDTMLLTPLFEKASSDPLYRFDVEDALMLREYIHRHPDKKELVKKMLDQGRISCGSTYIQPYEEMYSGESLARQFYLGARWLKKEFGYEATTYWNEDVPGRTLQMPQIMAKAGTRYLMLSRHEKGLFNWASPDGSSVFAYSPGHYSEAFTPLNKNFFDATDYISQLSLDFEKYFMDSSVPAAIPLLSDWDMSPAKEYSQLISFWHRLSTIQNEKKEFVPVRLPEIHLSLAPDFLKTAALDAANVPTITGERPAVWLYIHGPSHQKAVKASREGDILLTQAEKFAVMLSLIRGNLSSYPEKEITEAWESKIYPDHGWGGKNGDITDHIFWQKYLDAKTGAEKILFHALNGITSEIKTDARKGKAIVVFNSLNWKRTDVATVRMQFAENEVFNFVVEDPDGKPVPFQVTGSEIYTDGSLRSVSLVITAAGIPSVGYRVFYLRPVEGEIEVRQTEFTGAYENQFYKVVFGKGGLQGIHDKELNMELVDPSKFTAGEVFTLNSVGNGAGEFADIQKTDMKDYDKTGNSDTEWTLTADGPVFTSFKYRQKIKYATVEEEIRIYKQVKRIDFIISLLNWEGVLYREFRMALPVNMTDGEVSYEVPYGKVTVGKDEIPGYAGERYKTNCSEVHPRGIENWIGAGNGTFGVTLSSSVAAADYIDPTDSPIPNHVLQPILLASRHSCHHEGNPYLQTGDHHFSFSFTSHAPGWDNGLRFGRQANEKLIALPADKRYVDASMPEELSFFNADVPGIVITAIKKAEDANAVIVRGYNYAGREIKFKAELFKPVNLVLPVNLIEEPGNNKPVEENTLTFGKFSIETFLIK